MKRLSRRWKAALQILLLALIVAAPGAAQPAFAGCPHREAKPAVVVQSAASAVDCHENMTVSPEPKNMSDHGPNDTPPPCCDTGMSCASAIALPVSFADPVYFAVANAPAVTLIAGYRSHIPSPDYPPPRA